MTDCDHPWAAQDEIGRPYCQACGKPWGQVRKEEAVNRHRCECSICTERGEEIDRLQEAKRAALKLADERAIEANRMRALVKGGLDAVNAAIQQTHAEQAGHDRSADKCCRTVEQWRKDARAALGI